MSSPRTRRAALRAGAAMVGALYVPGLALAAAPAVDLDAELFALLDRWSELQHRMSASADAYDAASVRANGIRPPRPAELWSGFGDKRFILGAGATGWEQDANGVARSFFHPGDVERIRAAGPVMRWANTGETEKPHREPDPEGEARRQEIIGAHDRWKAERKAVEDAVGYTAACDALEVRALAINEAEDAIALCPARTLPGLARKGAWVADLMADDGGPNDLGEIFARQVAAFAGGVA